jgi:hypothetical protein
MRICSCCEEEKTETEFYYNPKTKSHFSSWCKACTNIKSKETASPQRVKDWCANNPEKVRRHRRRTQLKRKFNLNPHQYQVMLEAQDFKCAICGIPSSNLSKALCVDHNHKTNSIRQLLCSSCNLVLGNSSDNIEILEQAIIYLKRHSTL